MTNSIVVAHALSGHPLGSTACMAQLCGDETASLVDRSRIDRTDVARHHGTNWDDTIEAFDSFCAGVLRPAYLQTQAPPIAQRDEWAVYRAINGAYASLAAERATVGSIVTIRGYELQLLPAMLRSMRPDLQLELHLDIPFPGPRAFEKLPWRNEIVESLMAANIVYVQTSGDETALRSATASPGRTPPRPASARDSPVIATNPTCLDHTSWERLASLPAVRLEANEVRRRVGSPRVLVLGFGDLDDAAGTEVRLQALEQLLRSGRVQGEQVKMIEIVRPAVSESEFSRRQRRGIEVTVGRINGDFGGLGSPVVHYQHRDLNGPQRCALHLTADVLVATPMHHGVNIPALEFVASRLDGLGALILSEFSPSATSMAGAVQVNPFDPEALASALHATIHMDTAEQTRRMRSLQRGLRAGVKHSAVIESRRDIDAAMRAAPTAAAS